MGFDGDAWGAFWHSLLLGILTFALGYGSFLRFEQMAVERA
jgi:hypothetical protein